MTDSAAPPPGQCQVANGGERLWLVSHLARCGGIAQGESLKDSSSRNLLRKILRDRGRVR
jgi:hypothetical protein